MTGSFARRSCGFGRAGRWLALAAGLLALCSAGCMQLETRVRYNEDGTATVTERLRFSRMLLDQAGDKQAELLKLLGREAALERMKSMGKGVSLASHELRDAAGSSRESVAVFKVEDLNGFRYVSPWPAFPDYPQNNIVEFSMQPAYKSSAYNDGVAGTMVLRIKYLKPPKGEPQPPKDAPPPKGPTPLDMQVYREISPVIRDMLKDFRVRLTFESFSPVHSRLGVRGESGGAKSIDLLDFSDANLDSWGSQFVANEEIALELVQWRFGGPNVVRHVNGYWNNATLPVFYPWGSRHMWWGGGMAIYCPPSRQLFDKHFAGRKLDYSQWQASPPDKQVTADFERIGWKGLGKKDGDKGKEEKKEPEPQSEPAPQAEPPKAVPAGEPEKK